MSKVYARQVLLHDITVSEHLQTATLPANRTCEGIAAISFDLAAELVHDIE